MMRLGCIRSFWNTSLQCGVSHLNYQMCCDNCPDKQSALSLHTYAHARMHMESKESARDEKKLRDTSECKIHISREPTVLYRGDNGAPYAKKILHIPKFSRLDLHRCVYSNIQRLKAGAGRQAGEGEDNGSSQAGQEIPAAEGCDTQQISQSFTSGSGHMKMTGAFRFPAQGLRKISPERPDEANEPVEEQDVPNTNVDMEYGNAQSR